MKKLLIIFTLVVLPFYMSGQNFKQKHPVPLAKFDANVKAPLTAKERAQIIEVYGDSADKLVFSIPSRLKSVKHILRNRVVIKLILDEKDKKPCPKLSELPFYGATDNEAPAIETFDPNNFNPLKYGFNFYTRTGAMYQVDKTNYYIIIKSQYQ